MSYIYVKRYGGFCNSLILWQFAYRVAKLNNLKVAVYTKHFPEFNFLEVPNTILLNEQPTNLLLLNSNTLDNSFIINNKNPILFTCEWGFNKFFCNEIHKPISQIKLKDKNLDLKIKNTCSDFIGIHLRRGDYKSIPEAYTSDKWYYNNCQAENNKKIYLSTDGSVDDIKFLNVFNIHRYNLFVNKKQSDSINCHYLSENNPHRTPDSLSTIDSDLILIKLIDLFSLSYCEKIYGSESTFSITASILNGTKIEFPNPKYYEVMSKFL